MAVRVQSVDTFKKIGKPSRYPGTGKNWKLVSFQDQGERERDSLPRAQWVLGPWAGHPDLMSGPSQTRPARTTARGHREWGRNAPAASPPPSSLLGGPGGQGLGSRGPESTRCPGHKQGWLRGHVPCEVTESPTLRGTSAWVLTPHRLHFEILNI